MSAGGESSGGLVGSGDGSVVDGFVGGGSVGVGLVVGVGSVGVGFVVGGTVESGGVTGCVPSAGSIGIRIILSCVLYELLPTSFFSISLSFQS